MSTQSPSLLSSIIETITIPQWLSVQEYSALISRPERTVLRWCEDGTFTAFGIRTQLRPRYPLRRNVKRNGQWWIFYVPSPLH